MNYIIVAYDKNRVIGSNGELPWQGRMKTDMARLRQLTTGNAIIMGRKTFDSIGRALPNRQNIVITHNPQNIDGVQFVTSLDEAYAVVEPGRDAYIFGGGQIFAMALESGTVDEILATEIDATVEGDAFFPELDAAWTETSRQHFDADENNIYAFDFVQFHKK